MVAPAPDTPVRVRLKCSDAEDFVARFAPNVTRGGIFLPTHKARDVGSSIRFELVVLDGSVVFAGVGVVTWAKPKGMGVKFTTLDPATEPMLERLLNRRLTAETPAEPADSEPEAANPAPVAAAPATDTSPTSVWRDGEGNAAPVAAAAATDTSPTSLWQGQRRRWVRPLVALAAALVCVAIVAVAVGRTRSAAPPVEIAAPPPVATAPAPPAEAPASAPTPPIATATATTPIATATATKAIATTTPTPAETTTGARSRPPTAAPVGGLRVERVTVGASTEGSTCPEPIARFSVKSHKAVNVCLQVAHRPQKTDHVTLIWERNGAFSGKTPVEIPASKPNFRSHTHMKISQNRIGAWSVRVVSDRNVSLAQASFEVAP